MTDDDSAAQQYNVAERHKDLDSILAVAKSVRGLMQKVVSPLIVVGVLALISNWLQFREMAGTMSRMQESQIQTNLRVENMNEKLLRIWYAGGWERHEVQPK